MHALSRSLAAAVVLAAAPALAHERAPQPPPPVAVPAPPPLAAAPAPGPEAGRHRIERPWFGWPALNQLREEYRQLERDRERFSARWRGNPGALRRFERWVAARRSELDRRYAALTARGGPARRLAWADGHRD